MGNINNKETYILIPSYEPEKELIPLVESLNKEGFDIILVNDGSGKEYDEIFNQVKDKVIYLEQYPNKGKGQALRLGFSYANINNKEHKFVITVDGDGQHSIKDILKVNEILHEHNVLTFGIREFDEKTPKRSRNGNFMSRLCRTVITKDFVQDDQCGLRGFPISYMNELLTIRGDHYEYEMNVVCLSQLKRYRNIQVPIETIYLDNNSNSHFSPGLDTYRIQTIIWQYDLVPLIGFIFGVAAFGVFDWLFNTYWYFPFNEFVTFSIAQWFGYLTYFGLMSLFFPTKQIGRRSFIEGLFFAVKGTFAVGIFSLLVFLLHLWSPLSYFIATFIVCFLNYFLALIIFKVRKVKSQRRIK